MKDFSIGHIFHKCSTRMHCRGKIVKMYEHTAMRQKCPNCGKLRKVKV